MLKEPKTFLSQERILVTDEFIERNKLSLIPSKQVKARYESVGKEDFFGWAGEVLLDYISFEDAKEYFKSDYVEEVKSGATKHTTVTDINEAAQDFLDYMNFAWGKAQDERGISAGRSIMKLREWLFVMNRPDLAEEIDREDLYPPYGAPALISICEKMGIQVPDSLRRFAGV